MAENINVDEVTALLNNPSVPIELRNEIANDWAIANPTAKDTWGPLVDKNGLTLTEDTSRFTALVNDSAVGAQSNKVTEAARAALARDVGTGNTVAGATSRSSALASSIARAGTSDELLDQGSDGLRYFEVFLPLYSRVQSAGEMSRDAACARYDESREMSFATLRSDAGTLAEAVSGLESELRCIDDQHQHLAAVWTGKAATAALTYLGTFTTEAAQVRTWMTDASTALAEGADQLEAAVRAKAVAVSPLYTGQVGGKTPDQVDTLITVMLGNPFSSQNDNTIKAMAQWFPGIEIDTECLSNDLTQEVRHAAKQSCGDFINRAFLPGVEHTWSAFIRICNTCDTSVVRTYNVITDTLAKVDQKVFAPLDGSAGGGGSGRGGGDGFSPVHVPSPVAMTSQGGSTGQVPTPVAGAGPALALNPRTVPAGLPTGAGWVSDPELHSAAVKELADGKGAGDLGGAANKGGDITQRSGQNIGTATTDGVPGSVITMSDHGVSMQISANDAAGAGAHIAVTGANGQVSGYRVEIGPDGQPRLVPDTTQAALAAGKGATTVPAAEAVTNAAPAAAATLPTYGGGGHAAAVDPATGEPAAASPLDGPVQAQVHSASVGDSWFQPGGADHDPVGAQLASAHDDTAGHPTSGAASGAVLAGAGQDGAALTGLTHLAGAGGMAGAGGWGGAGGGEAHEPRASQQWRLLEDTFGDDSGTWASFSDVLGAHDRQAAGEQKSR